MSSSSSREKPRGPVLRSLSPSGRFCSYTQSRTPFSTPSSVFASSINSSFSSPSSTFHIENNDNHYNHHHHNYQHNSHHRSASPTRVNLYTPNSRSAGLRFSIDPRSISPNRSISNHVITTKKNRPIPAQKKTCMCSPTNHPGSFRCSLHKNVGSHNTSADSYPSTRLNMRRSAMKNSLRIVSDYVIPSIAIRFRLGCSVVFGPFRSPVCRDVRYVRLVALRMVSGWLFNCGSEDSISEYLIGKF
ncbi:unnamed protein product [Lathyrus oleraceus]